MTPPARLYCAIDTPDLERARWLVRNISPITGTAKLGLEFFNAQGPQGVRAVMAEADGVSLFLDLKFHDIPNTVAQAVRAATALQPEFLNVHASGGLEMMQAARDAAHGEAAKLGIAAPSLLAVTVLTSLDDAALGEVGQAAPAAAQVVRLAQLTRKAGLDGIVCSAHEIELLRRECGPDFVLMVPGIRPAGSAANDQKRIMTPAEALCKGATHLVAGRPITAAPDPVAAARQILADMAGHA